MKKVVSSSTDVAVARPGGPGRVLLSGTEPCQAGVGRHALAAKFAKEFVQIVGRVPLLVKNAPKGRGNALVRRLPALDLAVDVIVDGNGFAAHVVKMHAPGGSVNGVGSMAAKTLPAIS